MSYGPYVQKPQRASGAGWMSCLAAWAAAGAAIASVADNRDGARQQTERFVQEIAHQRTQHDEELSQQRDQHESALAQQNEHHRTQLAQQKQHHESQLAQQQAHHESEIEGWTEFRRESRRPLLAVDYCCNSVPISNSFDESAREFHLEVVARPDDFRRRGIPFVVQIANYGHGPALETKVYWNLTDVEFKDGTRKRFTEEESNGSHRPHTWPAFISPSSLATVNHLPSALWRDVHGDVETATGYLRIVCKDTDGEQHEFRHDFTLNTRYEPEGDENPYGPRINFHFTDHSATTAAPHSVAKPPVGTASEPNMTTVPARSPADNESLDSLFNENPASDGRVQVPPFPPTPE